MSEIKALRSSDVSPNVLIDSLIKDSGKIKQMYVIAFSNNGEPMVYTAGDLGGLGFASIIIQDLALKYINGLIIHEG